MISRLILFFFLLVICHTSSAQVGCIAYEDLYTYNSTWMYDGVELYLWDGTNEDPNRISYANGKCIQYFTPSRGCYVRFHCNSRNVCTNWYGTEVMYSDLPCNAPIDDYIPLFVLIIGGIGVFFLKKD